VSFSIALVQYILNPRQKFILVPSVARPLLFVVVVVLVTAGFRGGIGIAALGSETYGGKKYLMIISAVIGFFAITSRPIAPRRAVIWVVVFLLASASAIIGDVAGLLGPGLYYIYLFLPLGEYGYESVATELH